MEDENDAKASLAEQIKSLRSQCKRKGVKWVDQSTVKSSMASSPGGKRRSVGEDAPLPITLKGDEASDDSPSKNEIKDDSGLKANKGEIKMAGDMKKDIEKSKRNMLVREITFDEAVPLTGPDGQAPAPITIHKEKWGGKGILKVKAPKKKAVVEERAAPPTEEEKIEEKIELDGPEGKLFEKSISE
jgi:hypothetical protein